MAQAYFSLVTHAGRIKLAASAAGGDPVTITHFAVGDGNGADTNPTTNSTALVHEVWRTQVESVATDPDNPSAILVTAIIPTNAGGWWMREFGIFDKSGTMIAVARPVSQYKPTALEGQLEDIRYEFQIVIGEAANVTLLVDPSLIFATRDWVQTRKIAMAQMNRLPWLPVISMSLTAPPTEPPQGGAWLVPSNASGPWAGKGGMIAEWIGKEWFYSTPADGHGVSLPDGRVFQRIVGQYAELLASESRSGLVELATIAEAMAGVDLSRAVTPAGLAAAIAAAITKVINGSPAALDTLVEFAAALGNDANFATTMINALAGKVDLTRTATDIRTGIVELATPAEATAGTDATRAVTPAGLSAAISAAITKIINGSPAALDTLVELAAALGNDANFATTMTNALAGKVDLTRTATDTRTGIVELATADEVGAGTDLTRAITPAALAQRLNVLTSDTQSRKWNFAVAGGTANELTATLTPAPTAYSVGLLVRLMITATNTVKGPTFNLNGLGARSITYVDGSGVVDGEFVNGRIAELVYDGTKFILMNPWVSLLRLSPAGAKQTRAFTANVALSDLPVSTDTVAQTITVAGTSYLDCVAYWSFKNQDATFTSMIGYLRLRQNATVIATSDYLGCSNKDGVQIPITIRERFYNLNPNLTYVVELMVKKSTAIGPVVIQDTRILALHE
ncbi:phage tail protein [Rhizobium sp.]|jgi:phage-related tail fiber protein|uniref:phage tail-collar fiber domain-containing protein n=1 Tax=Rhizobium sp. TaxID=391 RepID=UPI000E82FB8F|nr:hypothetical protein [Rhizobium sp.]